MKKRFKIIFVSIFIIALLFVVDFVCIFKFNRPLFAIKKDDGFVYRGLFYDTYNCQEYSVPQIKAKGSKFTCVVFDITDDSDKTSANWIEPVKVNVVNFSSFNKYLDMDDYEIFLSNNIKEIYYVSSNVKYTLKEYNTNVMQNSSDIIKELTDLLDLVDTLKDGGTTIYKSQESDITLVKCNTIAGNKNIFIGDYSMSFDSDLMCN